MKRTRVAWDEVVTAAHGIADEREASGARPVVTTTDLMGRLGICRHTAQRYIGRLREGGDGFERVQLRSRGGRRGPAPQAVIQTGQ